MIISCVDGSQGCEQPLTVRFADPKRPRPGESRYLFAHKSIFCWFILLDFLFLYCTRLEIVSMSLFWVVFSLWCLLRVNHAHDT